MIFRSIPEVLSRIFYTLILQENLVNIPSLTAAFNLLTDTPDSVFKSFSAPQKAPAQRSPFISLRYNTGDSQVIRVGYSHILIVFFRRGVSSDRKFLIFIPNFR